MLKKIITRYLKKHGLKKVLLEVGNIAVKTTKSKEDDKLWAKIKALIEA